MKRHTQFTGVRNWYGEDLLDLQGEPLKVLDTFFNQYGEFIVSGCNITRQEPDGDLYDIEPGLVALQGPSAEDENVMVSYVVPFAGKKGTQLPCPLVLTHETEERDYVRDVAKPVYYDYTAREADQPGDVSTFCIDMDAKRFADALQDESHYFVTGDQIASWTNKVDREEGKGLSQNDFTDTYKAIIEILVQDREAVIVQTSDELMAALKTTIPANIYVLGGAYTISEQINGTAKIIVKGYPATGEAIITISEGCTLTAYTESVSGGTILPCVLQDLSIIGRNAVFQRFGFISKCNIELYNDTSTTIQLNNPYFHNSKITIKDDRFRILGGVFEQCECEGTRSTGTVVQLRNTRESKDTIYRNIIISEMEKSESDIFYDCLIRFSTLNNPELHDTETEDCTITYV